MTITGRNQTTLDEVARELGDRALVIQADVSDHEAMQQVIGRTVERFGNIDIVFANAGISAPTPLGDAALQAFERVLKVNVTSTFFLIQACLPHLNDNASVIFTGSVQGVNGRPGWGAYAASKAALRTLARVLASELSPRGIRVNVVTPGSVHTPLVDEAAVRAEDPARFFQKLQAAIPLARMGRPDEVANAVLFLASDESSFVQASELVVDGGATGAFAGAPLFK